MNSERFLANQQTYFSGSYKGFCEFGGPCVYFHHECIRAGHEGFLSARHIEMLYAETDGMESLFHVLPQLIPPIDRQYTVRFFTQPSDKWRDSKGKFKPVMLPSGLDGQFDLFHSVCMSVKRLIDRVDRGLLEREAHDHGVTAPKAIDNAIVNYVRIVAATALGPV